MKSTKLLSPSSNELEQRKGGENRIEENKPDRDGWTRLDINDLERLALDKKFSELYNGDGLNAKENRKKELKSQGINLSLDCPRCEKSFEADDIVVTKLLNDGSRNYYPIPTHCDECTKLYAKYGRQDRRRKIICFFADDSRHPNCAICGNDDYKKLELDHIAGNGKQERLERKDKPRRKGWEWDHKGEYQILCKTCNRRKSDFTLETIIPIYRNLLKHSEKKTKESISKKENMD